MQSHQSLERKQKERILITLGDTEVQRIGLGTNRVTDSDESRDVLREAALCGPIYIDTADIYQNGESESTIGETFAQSGAGVVIGTKGGMVRGADPDNSEPHLRVALAASLRRLKLDTIFLYQLHRVDPRIPIEDTMRLLKCFQQEGTIRHIGLSEVTIEEIERARAAADIVSVQNQYNLYYRTHDAVIYYCEAHGIVFMPWFPLGRVAIGEQDLLAEIADCYGVTPQQLALAWLLKRSTAMLAIPGTLSIEHLEENFSALDIELEEADFKRLSEIR